MRSIESASRSAIPVYAPSPLNVGANTVQEADEQMARMMMNLDAVADAMGEGFMGYSGYMLLRNVPCHKESRRLQCDVSAVLIEDYHPPRTSV